MKYDGRYAKALSHHAIFSLQCWSKIFLIVGILSFPLIDPVPHADSAFEQSNSTPGAMKGRVAVVTNDGSMHVPESSTVYVIYYHREPPYGGRGTAGDAYFAEQLKVANSIAKQTAKNKQQIEGASKDQRQDRFVQAYLESVDQGLKEAAAWASDHPEKSWQFALVKTGPDGRWSKDVVRPGHYKIIVRGNLGDLDAEWETQVDVNAGETIAVPLTKLTFGRRSTKPS